MATKNAMARSGIGSEGGGMKLRNPFSPQTRKTRPSNTREAVVPWRAIGFERSVMSVMEDVRVEFMMDIWVHPLIERVTGNSTQVPKIRPERCAVNAPFFAQDH